MIYKTIKILVALFVAVLLISCGSDDSDGSSNNGTYPRKVTITYKITSTTLTKVFTNFTNETGGTDTLNDLDVPFETEFEVEVNQGDTFSLTGAPFGARYEGEGDVTTIILVDGEEVESKTSRGIWDAQPTSISVYVFP